MNDKQKVAAAVVATALAVGGGSALASGGHSGSSRAATAAAASHDVGHPGGIDAAAAYLGLTVDELRTQLAAGKSLADVATAQGKSVSGLVAALVADLKTHLDQAVAAGRLTGAQESTILADAAARITTMVNAAGLPGRGGDRAGLMHAAAQYLGLTDAQLQSQLEGGQSLAQVAAAQGKAVGGLEDALVAQFRSSLDAFVNATHPEGLGPMMMGGPFRP